MREEKVVRPVIVMYRCDNCNRGYMESSEYESTTHQCDSCGHIAELQESYPNIEYRDEVMH